VALGAPVNGLRVVTEGLRPGERIVVNGLQRVRPGSLLQPQAVSMEAKSELKADVKAAAKRDTATAS
jgi:membrane fusion protein, multidrug efflux system